MLLLDGFKVVKAGVKMRSLSEFFAHLTKNEVADKVDGFMNVDDMKAFVSKHQRFLLGKIKISLGRTFSEKTVKIKIWIFFVKIS